MAGLVPAIHALLADARKTWMPAQASFAACDTWLQARA